MKKTEELLHFHEVYSTGANWKVTPWEGPDFLCQKHNTTVLGVEITELFAHETDARIKKIDGYALALLNGAKFRHKDDPRNIKVEKAKFSSKDGGNEREINGIFHEKPSLKQSVALLHQAVEYKQKRLEAYLESCSVIDLIVHDSSNLFWFDEYRKFFSPFSHFVNRRRFMESGFREIFLVTYSKDEKVLIPIKMNLFAEDAFILEKLVKEWAKAQAVKDPRRLFLILLSCMSEVGYQDLSAYIDCGNVGIVVASNVYLYSKNGKRILDYRTMPEQVPKGDRLGEALDDMDNQDKEIVREITMKRTELSCCVNLLFNVHNVEQIIPAFTYLT